MHTILEKYQFSENVFALKVHAPEIARNRRAGQFVIVQLDIDYGERIPLTVADAHAEEGWIMLVIQAVGASTIKLCSKNAGDEIPAILGPLGMPTNIKKVGKVVCVGGGIGVAPLHPIAQAYKKAGNEVVVIIGGRTKELVIFEERMRKIDENLIIVTDDGSYGRKGLVTEPLKEICESDAPPDEVVAIGPPVMMKFCALTTKPFNIHTVVSLNALMIDGTGMCGCCRVSVDGKKKFVCVDGPEFNGHQVDFDNMMIRMKSFKQQEDEARHICRSAAIS